MAAGPDKSSTEEVAKPKISRAETLAYMSALLVNLVDQMGPQFSIPVLVTYGQWIGGSLATIATFQTTRGISSMLSCIWMPMMSDKFGRKWIAFVSVAGCSLGYFTQGIAYKFRGDDPQDWGPACIVFICGRFIVGFFSGMQPVLQAYVTELSAPDVTLITQRLVVMQVVTNVGGVILSPLAGVVAGFGMQVPFMVCAVIGVLAMFFVPIFLKEVKDIKGTGAEPSVSSSEEAAPKAPSANSDARDAPLVEAKDVESASAQERRDSFQEREAERNPGSPFFDVVIALLFAAYAFLMVLINSGALFLMPILFQQPSFGIKGDTDEEVQKNVSRVVGFAGMPLGVVQIIVAIFLFVPVTKKFGEVPIIVFSGMVATTLFPIVGIWADKVWKVVFLNTLIGAAFGFIGPALGPVAAKYGHAIYPKQMALVQGIPLVGLQLSNAFSQNMLAAIVGDIKNPRLAAGYWTAAAFCVLFVIAFAFAATLSAARCKAAHAASGASEDVEKTYAAVLERSPSSVGIPTIAPYPVASPAHRRAMSQQIGSRRPAPNRRSISAGDAIHRRVQDVGASMQPVEGS